MTASWIYKISSGMLDVRDQPIKYMFTYDVGTMATKVEMATSQYEWVNENGERQEEASSVILEPLMAIQQVEPFMASEYEQWSEMCLFWASKN